MVRCEEIFRQICWLEQRYWPDVDGMGEEDESARLEPQVGIGSMGNGTFTGPLNQNMNGPMSNNTMTSQMSGQMNGQMTNNGINGQINGPMNPNSMNGTISSSHNGNQISGPNMNRNDSTPGPDGSNTFGQMTQMTQSS
jgi:hypothetical protein